MRNRAIILILIGCLCASCEPNVMQDSTLELSEESLTEEPTILIATDTPYEPTETETPTLTVEVPLTPTSTVLDTSFGQLRFTKIQMLTYEYPEGVLDIAWSPQTTNQLVAAGTDGSVIIWDAVEGKPLQTLGKFPYQISQVAWSKPDPNGRTYIAALILQREALARKLVFGMHSQANWLLLLIVTA
jgi:hypothetical protein